MVANTRLFLSLVACIVIGGCASDEDASPDAGSFDADNDNASDFVIESAAFEDGGTIPDEHRCANAPSPPLSWRGAPSGTESYAVVMRDLDFMGGYLHWILYDIPASTTEIEEGVPTGYEPAFPAGARQADVLTTGYFGPCSPISVNTYEFKVYALDVASLPDLDESSSGSDVAAAIEEHALAEAALQGSSGP